MPVQERLQAHTDEEHKMEEDNENGEFPHAVNLKFRDYLFCLYHVDSRSNCLDLFHRLAHNVTLVLGRRRANTHEL